MHFHTNHTETLDQPSSLLIFGLFEFKFKNQILIKGIY